MKGFYLTQFVNKKIFIKYREWRNDYATADDYSATYHHHHSKTYHHHPKTYHCSTYEPHSGVSVLQ